MKESDTPAIEIVMENSDREYLLEIIYGIEEEGIPYRITEEPKGAINKGNVVSKAYIVSQKSKLQTGIAVCPEKTAFHFSKLKEECPLFVIENIADMEKEKLRIYGNNIARIVKGIPLK